MRFTSLILWVQENESSAKWYKKLGFDLVRSDDDKSIVRLGDFEIWLVNMHDDEQFAGDALTSVKGKGMYMYIAVDDIEETHQQFIANGIRPYTRPKDWPWGTREFIVKDPDGYKLCFWQERNK